MVFYRENIWEKLPKAAKIVMVVLNGVLTYVPFGMKNILRLNRVGGIIYTRPNRLFSKNIM